MDRSFLMMVNLIQYSTPAFEMSRSSGNASVQKYMAEQEKARERNSRMFTITQGADTEMKDGSTGEWAETAADAAAYTQAPAPPKPPKAVKAAAGGKEEKGEPARAPADRKIAQPAKKACRDYFLSKNGCNRPKCPTLSQKLEALASCIT